MRLLLLIRLLLNHFLKVLIDFEILFLRSGRQNKVIGLPHIPIPLNAFLGNAIGNVIVGATFVRLVVFGVFQEDVIHIRTSILV